MGDEGLFRSSEGGARGLERETRFKNEPLFSWYHMHNIESRVTLHIYKRYDVGVNYS